MADRATLVRFAKTTGSSSQSTGDEIVAVQNYRDFRERRGDHDKKYERDIKRHFTSLEARLTEEIRRDFKGMFVLDGTGEGTLDPQKGFQKLIFVQVWPSEGDEVVKDLPNDAIRILAGEGLQTVEKRGLSFRKKTKTLEEDPHRYQFIKPRRGTYADDPISHRAHEARVLRYTKESKSTSQELYWVLYWAPTEPPAHSGAQEEGTVGPAGGSTYAQPETPYDDALEHHEYHLGVYRPRQRTRNGQRFRIFQSEVEV